jgi:hypothetical protein
VETHQLVVPVGRFWRGVLLAGLLAMAAGGGGCAAAVPETRVAPVVLAQRCRTGPYCVTGQIDDQYAAAVEGAHCVALAESGQSTIAISNKQGVFFMDGPGALPHELRFEKPGYSAQTVPVQAAAPGVTRLYVILHHVDANECTCEPSALISGREPCPADSCGRSQFDMAIPESPPPAESTPPPATEAPPPAP